MWKYTQHFTANTSTCVAVISADRYSRAFERKRHADYGFKNVSELEQERRDAERSTVEVAKQWVSEQRYPIVFGSWVASMAIAFGLVGRNPYLTGQQKLVQARVYAQGLTLAVLIASFALEGNDLREGKGRWETVKVLDPDDPTHQRMIEKKIHHEAYTGEDQWMGKWHILGICVLSHQLLTRFRLDMIEAEEKKMKSRGLSAYGKDKKKE